MRAIAVLTASCAVALTLSACAESSPMEPSTEAPAGPSLASGTPSRCGEDQFSYTCIRYPNGDSVGVGEGLDAVAIYDMSPSGDVVGSYGEGGDLQAFFWSEGTLYDLEGGQDSEALAINARGQVVGYGVVTGGDGPRHALLWENVLEGGGQFPQDLGTLGGETSMATGISPSGRVTGTSWTATGELHRFLWYDGVMTDLGPV
jgi:probable HAF family extracellular repeat protein